MKKLYYAIYGGKAEIYRWDGVEHYGIFVSDSASKGDFSGLVTAETGGNCLGPDEFDEREELVELLCKNWDNLEQMEPEESKERIEHLAEEWGLAPEELEYLR